MCAVAALMNQTWAEDRVYDSDNTPLAQALQGETKPYIVVYTDEDVRANVGKEFYNADRTLTLVIEMGVATAIDTEQGGVRIQIPATDESFEFAIDMIESQVLGIIWGSTSSQWAEILRRIVMAFGNAPSRRGGSATAGTRWAARQLTLPCSVLNDQPPGVPVPEGHPIRDFIVLAQQEDKMSTTATLLAAMLDSFEAPDWRQAQAWLGLTEEGVRALGIAPVVLGDEIPPPLTDVEIIDTVNFDFTVPDIRIANPEISEPELGTAVV
jgi:hypothetical protein